MMIANPEFKVVLTLQRASSSCCNAGLMIAEWNGDLPEWTCRSCGKICERILTEEVCG